MTENIEEKKKEIKKELESLRHEFKVELPKKIAQARSYVDWDAEKVTQVAVDAVVIKAFASRVVVELDTVDGDDGCGLAERSSERSPDVHC